MQALGFEVLWKGKNFARLMGGLWVALRISLIAVGISLVAGVLMGALMTRKNPVVKALTRLYLETVRIMRGSIWRRCASCRRWCCCFWPSSARRAGSAGT